MTVNLVMEELSKDYIMALAHRFGYFNFSGRDFGVDLHLRRSLVDAATNRHYDDGSGIDVQLKSVMEKYIKRTNTHIKYNLSVKNYNDMVRRMGRLNGAIPLILIVFIFPDNRDEWLDVDSEKLTLRKCAYWYTLNKNAKLTTNKNSVLIDIPHENRIELGFFPELFKNLFN